MKKRDDQRSGTGGIDHDPTPPTPHPVAPEVGIELSSCLPDATIQVFKQGVMDALDGAGFANGEVLMRCVGDRQRVGIWTTHLTEAGERDRALGLPEINLLNAQERANPLGFAFRVSADLIDRFTAEAWNKTPKRLNSESQGPDPHGDVILHSFDVDYISPDRVKMTIKATKLITDPAPDVELTLVRNDTLSVRDSKLRCHSDSSATSDRSALWAFVIPLALVFPIPFFQVATSSDPESGHEGGPGCAAAAMYPSQVLIPNTNFKLVFEYQRVVVNAAGITAGGGMRTLGRDSAVSIVGPKDLNVIRGLPSAGGRFTLTTRDLRPPLSITWSGAQFTHPHQTSTDATFPVGAQLHLQEERVVKVTVTDADNHTVESNHHLTIHIRPDEP
jgi:hypothetical protein